MFRLILTATLVMIVSACAQQQPTIQTGPDAEVIFGSLHRVDGARASLAYVNPNVDFSTYNRFIVDELSLKDMEIVQPDVQQSMRARQKDWELTEKDEEFLRSAYREKIVSELEKNGYSVVDEPGAGVMRISSRIITIAPSAPKDDFDGRPAGRSYYITEGAGSMDIGAAFSDSVSDEVVAVLKDHKEASNTWGMNNRITNRSDVKNVFGSWARQFRARLDIIHGGNASGD